MSKGYRAIEVGMSELVNMLQHDLQLDELPALTEQQKGHLDRFAARIIEYTQEHYARTVEEVPYDSPDVRKWFPEVLTREEAITLFAKAIRDDSAPLTSMGLVKAESIGEKMVEEDA